LLLEFRLTTLPTRERSTIIEFHQKLIERLISNNKVVEALDGVSGDIGITIQDPEVRLRLIMDGANTRLIEVNGDDTIPDDPHLKMAWETAYNFWMGRLDIMSALFTGKVKIEGQKMDPLFNLKNIVPYARDACVDVATEMGWE